MNEPEEMSEKTQSSAIGMLAAMLAGLIISVILLTPVFFLPADQGILAGWIILFMILLMTGKNHRLEIGLFYPLTSLIYLGLAQTTLHSTLWPYVLVEKIWSVIVLTFVAFIIMSVTILLIAFLFGKR